MLDRLQFAILLHPKDDYTCACLFLFFFFRLEKPLKHGCKIAGCGQHAGKLRLAGWPCRQIEPSWQRTMPADLFYFFSFFVFFDLIVIVIFSADTSLGDA